MNKTNSLLILGHRRQRNRIQQFSQFTNGVTRVWRDDRPSDKILSITSFSIIRTRPEPYESSVFEAVGYKWRLVLYVNGNEKDGGKDHVSLYAKIVETESLPVGWEVNVDLKLFVYNGKLNKYLIVTGTLNCEWIFIRSIYIF
jgi:hypothetical protein